MAIKILHEKLATNVAMPVRAIEMATTFHAFIYHQMREALTRDNRNENEKYIGLTRQKIKRKSKNFIL